MEKSHGDQPCLGVQKVNPSSTSISNPSDKDVQGKTAPVPNLSLDLVVPAIQTLLHEQAKELVIMQEQMILRVMAKVRDKDIGGRGDDGISDRVKIEEILDEERGKLRGRNIESSTTKSEDGKSIHSGPIKAGLSRNLINRSPALSRATIKRDSDAEVFLRHSVDSIRPIVASLLLLDMLNDSTIQEISLEQFLAEPIRCSFRSIGYYGLTSKQTVTDYKEQKNTIHPNLSKVLFCCGHRRVSFAVFLISG